MSKSKNSWAIILLVIGLALSIFGIIQVQQYIDNIKLLAILSFFVPALQMVIVLLILLQNTYGFYMVYIGIGATAIGTVIALTD